MSGRRPDESELSGGAKISEALIDGMVPQVAAATSAATAPLQIRLEITR